MPQLALGAWTPIERYESAASVTMFVAIISGSSTSTTGSTFGSISPRISWRSFAPTAIAASMYSRWRIENASPRTGRAT